MMVFVRRAAVLGLALALIAASPAVAKALVAAPAPTPFRVISSEVVIVGKVTNVEEKTTLVKKDGQEYQVATVKVEQNIKGAKEVTHLRVAWPAPPKPQVNPIPNPNEPILIRPGIGRGRPAGMNLVKDQDVLLFLKKHESETFYVGSEFVSVVQKQGNPNFQTEVAEAEKGVRVLADPKAALQAKDANDRLLAVGILLNQYRQNRSPNPVQEPIDREENKLILKALAEADWAPNVVRPGTGGNMLQPLNLFFQLGATPADGWMQPQNFKEIGPAAKKWLEANTDKFVIKRFVTASDK